MCPSHCVVSRPSLVNSRVVWRTVGEVRNVLLGMNAIWMRMALLRRHPRWQPARRASSEVNLFHVPRPFFRSLELITLDPASATAPLRLAKRAETRECPVCGDHIPLRLLGQHYTLESTRVQTLLDHVGDLDAFSDPHGPPHAPYVYHSSLLKRPCADARLSSIQVHCAPPRRAISDLRLLYHRRFAPRQDPRCHQAPAQGAKHGPARRDA